jgi:hypothetical protein
MKIKTVLILPVLFIASCSSTQFTEYRSNEIIQGQGGAVRTVNGVEIWSDGIPDRKFKIIGVIDDSQRDVINNGVLSGMMQQSMESSARDSDLVNQTKLHGGNAVVVVQQGQILNGYVVSGNGMYQNNGNGGGMVYFNGDESARYSHLTKALVINYVDDLGNPVTNEPELKITNQVPTKINSK